MSKKENLKVVFDFIAEYLSDEKLEVKVEENKTIEATNIESLTERMIQIMKLVDEKRKKPIDKLKIIGHNERDYDINDDEEAIQSVIDDVIINTQTKANGNGVKKLKKALTDAKVIMNGINENHNSNSF